ncbi:MAG: CHAT domain-containing protein [Candidatus Krumholzibacteriota bacterium]|nr:CHAT domain-containing protein [Candidatus Krumholzibacteriota bacterium]
MKRTLVLFPFAMGMLLNLCCPIMAAENTAFLEALSDSISVLRIEGRYDEALKIAEYLLSEAPVTEGIRKFETEDLDRLVATLFKINRLTEREKNEMARADGMNAIYEEAYDKDEIEKAIAITNEQYDIKKNFLGARCPELARILTVTAFLHDYSGGREEAERYYRKALELDREILGKMHPFVAEDLTNLGILLHEMGRMEDVDTLYREAYAIYSSEEIDDQENSAWVMSSLGSLLKDKGELAEAEALFRRVLAVYRQMWGEIDPDVASCMNDLATTLVAKGDIQEAEPLFRQALNIYSQLEDDHSFDRAIVMLNLGSLLQDREFYAGAEQLYRQAIEIFEGIFGETDGIVSASYNNLADLFHDTGEYEKAEPLYLKALRIRREISKDNHPESAIVLLNLARNYRDGGNYQEAEQYYGESLSLFKDLLGQDHPYISMCLFSYSNHYLAQGKYKDAEPFLNQAIKVYDSSRLRVGTGFGRVTFQKSPYSRLADVLLSTGREKKAWQYAEREMGRVLAELLSVSGKQPFTEEEAETIESMRREIGGLEQRLAVLKTAAGEEGSKEADKKASEAYDELLRAQARLSEVQSRMAKKYPMTGGMAYQLKKIQKSLRGKTAMIGWLDVEEKKGEYSSWGYVIRKNGPVRWERLGPDGRERSGSPFRRGYDLRRSFASAGIHIEALAKRSKEFWEERMAPLSLELEDIERLIIIPSGAMLGLPVEALVDSDGSYLCEKYTISYAPSATISAWLAEKGSKRNRNKSKKALLVGDPPFSGEDLVVMSNDIEAPDTLLKMVKMDGASDEARQRGGYSRDSAAIARLPRLAGSREEIEEIAKISGESVVLLGPDASEKNLANFAVKGTLSSFSIIHIATHALIDDRYPERSSLVLSQAGLPDPVKAALEGRRIYDGLLSAGEIVREWDLDADLVNLSACETGLGMRLAGEGYIGLSHAFFQSGARSMVVSLWKVEDRATTRLMKRFYENYFGAYTDVRNGGENTPMPKAEALTEAKNWLMNLEDEDGSRPYEHPFYWSAFILIGDGGSDYRKN